MLYYYIIVAAPVHTPQTSTGSLPSHIKYFSPRNATSVSPPDSPTRFTPPYPLFNQSTLPSADEKEFSSHPPRSLPPPDTRNISSLLPTSHPILAPKTSSVTTFKSSHLLNLDPASDTYFLHPPFLLKQHPPPLWEKITNIKTLTAFYNITHHT